MCTAIATPVDAGWTVEEAALGFYPGNVNLLSLCQNSVPEPVLRILHCSGTSMIMDGTYGPVYAMNKLISLRLTEQTAVEYVRFFYAHVRGRHGLFQIVEKSNQLEWQAEAPTKLRRQVEGALLPLRAGRIDGKGHIRIPATMIFKNALVRTEAIVGRDGTMVDMGEPNFLYDDLPLRVDAIDQPPTSEEVMDRLRDHKGITSCLEPAQLAELIAVASVSPEISGNALYEDNNEEAILEIPESGEANLKVSEEQFSTALHIAEKHLEDAINESGSLDSYVAVAMVEAAVNRAVAATSHQDIIDMLRDLVEQIESDAGKE